MSLVRTMMSARVYLNGDTSIGGTVGDVFDSLLEGGNYAV
jgi:hypothetical protein